jgi:hypothetical protein
MLYRHVDVLNAAGLPAAIVHAKSGFRADWFSNDTRALASAEVTLHPDDVLVVPECYGPGLDRLPDGPHVVIINQAAYHTFDCLPFATTTAGDPYAQATGLVALLAVSQDNVALLRYAFPDIPVHLARPVVDSSVFYPEPGPRRRQIAFVANRRPTERDQLWHLLRARGLLDRWDLVAISNRTDLETARFMRESPIFVSFSEREGFGLPPAEAMASGCYVVGYPGLAGREFFDPAYSVPVAEDDQLGFAQAVEAACAAYEADPQAVAKLGQAASERILGHYTDAGLRDDLIPFYATILDA